MNKLFISRRRRLAALLALSFAGFAHAEQLPGPLTSEQRLRRVFQRRGEAAEQDLRQAPLVPEANGDEQRYADRRASFSKTLPHNELGEVGPEEDRRN